MVPRITTSSSIPTSNQTIQESSINTGDFHEPAEPTNFFLSPTTKNMKFFFNNGFPIEFIEEPIPPKPKSPRTLKTFFGLFKLKKN